MGIVYMYIYLLEYIKADVYMMFGAGRLIEPKTLAMIICTFSDLSFFKPYKPYKPGPSMIHVWFQ